MITTFFLGFVALMTAAIVALSARYRNGRFAFGVLAALCASATRQSCRRADMNGFDLQNSS